MNAFGNVPPDSTYKASGELHKNGLKGLIKSGEMQTVIQSAVDAGLPSLKHDFLCETLINDIEKFSAESDQWDVLRIYTQMANAVSKEKYASPSLHREISNKLYQASTAIKPSDSPIQDLMIGTKLFDKHAKCDQSKKAMATALQTIAQSIVENPTSDKAHSEAAVAMLEAIQPILKPVSEKSGRPVIGIKRAYLLSPSVE